MGAGLRGRVKKMKGLRSTNWWLQNSQWDVKYSTENMVIYTVITMHGVKCIGDLLG